MNERALLIPCAGEHLVGVLAMPDTPADTAVLVIVGGPQYRAGSHRQFVQLARHLAQGGYPVVRFDVRGMGDSEGATRGFEALSDDIGAAIDALRREVPGLRRVVLWGLCDGASAALLYLDERRDPLVQGLVLLNPWVRSEQTLARAHVKHYYLNRLRQGEFWRKLLRGGVAGQAMKDLLGNLRAARGSGCAATAAAESAALPFQERLLRGAESFAGPMLWVLSGQDYTAKEFVELVAAQERWQAVMGRGEAQRVDMATADHTFSAGADERALVNITASWLGKALPRELRK